MGLTEYIIKSRSGVYKDTPENRRLNRVGQRYGGSKAKREEREAYENRRDVANREESGRQYAKAKELLLALEGKGLSNFHISRSIRGWGVSTYVQNPFVKFRISDHSLSSSNRIMNEVPFYYGSDVHSLADFAYFVQNEKLKEEQYRRELLDKQKKEVDTLNSYWESIKSNFEGFVFKKIDRTYQDLEEFSKKGNRPRTNIYLKDLGKGAYSYEWTEPVQYNQHHIPDNSGYRKPSYGWLRWHMDNERLN